MEKAAGGVFKCLEMHPYCTACKLLVQYIRNAYRCVNPICGELAKPKTEDEVNWH